MKCKTKYKLLSLSVFTLLMAIGLNGFSQFSYTLYGFNFIPQSNHLNPAFKPNAEVVVGIPIFSSMSLNASSTGFSFNDLFQDSGDSLYLNLTNVIDNSGESNLVIAMVDIDLLYFGIQLKKGFLNAGVRNRVFARSLLATNLLRVAWYGNDPYLGQDMDLSQTWVATDHFNSWYAGFSFPIKDKVVLGVRLNLNQGMSNIETEKHGLGLRTDENQNSVYDVYANTDYKVNTSGLSGDMSVSDYFFNFSNFGVGVDLGAVYNINEKFSVNLSLLDLGFISWSSSLKTYESKYDSVYFAGIYADIDDENFDVSQVFADTLQELFDVIESEQKYSASLPTRLNVGGEFYFNERKSRVSLLFAGRFLPNYFDYAITAGYDMTVSDHFAFKATYTYMSYSPFNLGLGFVINARPFQIYALTDNVVSLINWSDAKYVNIQFGINLVWPKFKKMKAETAPAQ